LLVGGHLSKFRESFTVKVNQLHKGGAIMSMSIAQLEHLLDKLETLSKQLRLSSKPAEMELAHDDPLVKMAKECDFMLPNPLSTANLLETTERKINNVLVLLERAKQHQDIPSDARLAADNEDTLIPSPGRSL
jgi:hypothetical protein